MTWRPSPDWFLAFLEGHPFPDTDAILESIQPWWAEMSLTRVEELQALALEHALLSLTGQGKFAWDQTRVRGNLVQGFFVDWAEIRWDPKGLYPDWRHDRTRLFSMSFLPFYRRWIQGNPQWKTWTKGSRTFDGVIPVIFDAPCFLEWRQKMDLHMTAFFLDESLPEGIPQERIRARRL